MKTKMMKPIVVVTAFLTLTIACSKKDNTTMDVTVPLSKENLLGKWNFISQGKVEKTITDTILSETTSTYYPNSYFDFRSNDSAYTQIYDQGSFHLDTLYYIINNHQLFTVDNHNKKDTVNIIQLTKHKLSFSKTIRNENFGHPIIDEYTDLFSR